MASQASLPWGVFGQVKPALVVVQRDQKRIEQRRAEDAANVVGPACSCDCHELIGDRHPADRQRHAGLLRFNGAAVAHCIGVNEDSGLRGIDSPPQPLACLHAYAHDEPILRLGAKPALRGSSWSPRKSPATRTCPYNPPRDHQRSFPTSGRYAMRRLQTCLVGALLLSSGVTYQMDSPGTIRRLDDVQPHASAGRARHAVCRVVDEAGGDRGRGPHPGSGRQRVRRRRRRAGRAGAGQSGVERVRRRRGRARLRRPREEGLLDQRRRGRPRSSRRSTGTTRTTAARFPTATDCSRRRCPA